VSKNDYAFNIHIFYVNQISDEISACGSIKCTPSTGG
jgi:hypothetical protein